MLLCLFIIFIFKKPNTHVRMYVSMYVCMYVCMYVKRGTNLVILCYCFCMCFLPINFFFFFFFFFFLWSRWGGRRRQAAPFGLSYHPKAKTAHHHNHHNSSLSLSLFREKSLRIHHHVKREGFYVLMLQKWVQLQPLR